MNRETMTPVDEFAKSAMQTYMYICKPFQVNGGYIANTEYQKLAAYSYEIADVMMKEKYKRDTRLCVDCIENFATCNSDPEFGLGLGCDNVIKCNLYRKKDNHKIRTFFRRKCFSIINFFSRFFNKH